VEFVALLDAACPNGSGVTEEMAESALAEWFARDLAGRSGIDLGLGGLSETGGSLEALMETIRAAGQPAADLDLADVQGLYRLFKLNLAALHGYLPRLYPGRLLIVGASERPRTNGDARLGWAAVAAGILEVHELEGDHYSLLRRPQVGALASILAAALDRVPAPGQTAQHCWPQRTDNESRV
jgi:thioesterase domain-containing protein